MVRSQACICLSFVVWLTASIAGMTVLWNHETRPGRSAEAPTHWPSDSPLHCTESQSTMLVWIHPHCPCSRATIGELERLLVHLPSDVDCQVLLSRPPACDADFVETPLTRAVRRLPVQVLVDDERREAARFKIVTSGQVLLYGRNGELQFAGGITPGRGHAGDSQGSAKLREIFRAEPKDVERQIAECSVYGCALFATSDDRDPSL